MIIKEAEYTEKMVPRRVIVTPAIYGCDECKKELGDKDHRLKVTIFRQSYSATDKEFCSWRCVINHLPKIESDYFVDLPFMHYDEQGLGTGGHAKDLLEILKDVRPKGEDPTGS